MQKNDAMQFNEFDYLLSKKLTVHKHSVFLKFMAQYTYTIKDSQEVHEKLLPGIRCA